MARVGCMYIQRLVALHTHFVIILAGQGCQVPSDSHRKQDPQVGPLLQDQESTGPQLEVVRIASALGCFPF